MANNFRRWPRERSLCTTERRFLRLFLSMADSRSAPPTKSRPQLPIPLSAEYYIRPTVDSSGRLCGKQSWCGADEITEMDVPCVPMMQSLETPCFMAPITN